MMLYRKNAVDQSIDLFIGDSSSATGAGLTGLAHDTTDLACYYRIGQTGSATALSLVTQTVGGAHTDGGFVEIDATNMPGVYRLDLPDSLFAAAGQISMLVHGAANMAPAPARLLVDAPANKGIIEGTATGSPGTGSMDTSLTNFADDELIGRLMVVTSGVADGQARTITDSAATNGVLTFNTLQTALQSGDEFIVV